MTANLTDAEKAAELARLRAEFDKAVRLAGDMLRGTERPGHELEGEALTRFLDADEKASALRRRILQMEAEIGEQLGSE